MPSSQQSLGKYFASRDDFCLIIMEPTAPENWRSETGATSIQLRRHEPPKESCSNERPGSANSRRMSDGTPVPFNRTRSFKTKQLVRSQAIRESQSPPRVPSPKPPGKIESSDKSRTSSVKKKSLSMDSDHRNISEDFTVDLYFDKKPVILKKNDALKTTNGNKQSTYDNNTGATPRGDTCSEEQADASQKKLISQVESESVTSVSDKMKDSDLVKTLSSNSNCKRNNTNTNVNNVVSIETGIKRNECCEMSNSNPKDVNVKSIINVSNQSSNVISSVETVGRSAPSQYATHKNNNNLSTPKYTTDGSKNVTEMKKPTKISLAEIKKQNSLNKSEENDDVNMTKRIVSPVNGDNGMKVEFQQVEIQVTSGDYDSCVTISPYDSSVTISPYERDSFINPLRENRRCDCMSLDEDDENELSGEAGDWKGRRATCPSKQDSGICCWEQCQCCSDLSPDSNASLDADDDPLRSRRQKQHLDHDLHHQSIDNCRCQDKWSHRRTGSTLTVQRASSGGNSRLLRKQSSGGSVDSGQHSIASPLLSRDNSTELTAVNYEAIDLNKFVKETLNKSYKDRITLLKIEHELTCLVKDPHRYEQKFPQSSSYGRLLIHRCAELFGLKHGVDAAKQNVYVAKPAPGLPQCKIPSISPFQQWCIEKFLTSPTIFCADQPPLAKSILKRDAHSLDDEGATLQASKPTQRSKSFEQREEEYSKARQRIFNSTDQEEQWDWERKGDSITESCKPQLLLPEGEKMCKPARLIKVQSLENHETVHIVRGVVSKAHSFGGYGDRPSVARQDSTVSTHSAPPTRILSHKGELASSNWRLSPGNSSGYRTLSVRSDSITPSPTPNNGDSLPTGCGVLWAITDMSSVPAGAIIIHPQTGQPLTNSDGSLYHYDPAHPPNTNLLSVNHVSNDGLRILNNPERRRSRLEKQRATLSPGSEIDPHLEKSKTNDNSQQVYNSNLSDEFVEQSQNHSQQVYNSNLSDEFVEQSQNHSQQVYNSNLSDEFVEQSQNHSQQVYNSNLSDEFVEQSQNHSQQVYNSNLSDEFVEQSQNHSQQVYNSNLSDDFEEQSQNQGANKETNAPDFSATENNDNNVHPCLCNECESLNAKMGQDVQDIPAEVEHSPAEFENIPNNYDNQIKKIEENNLIEETANKPQNDNINNCQVNMNTENSSNMPVEVMPHANVMQDNKMLGQVIAAEFYMPSDNYIYGSGYENVPEMTADPSLLEHALQLECTGDIQSCGVSGLNKEVKPEFSDDIVSREMMMARQDSDYGVLISPYQSVDPRAYYQTGIQPVAAYSNNLTSYDDPNAEGQAFPGCCAPVILRAPPAAIYPSQPYTLSLPMPPPYVAAPPAAVLPPPPATHPPPPQPHIYQGWGWPMLYAPQASLSHPVVGELSKVPTHGTFLSQASDGSIQTGSTVAQAFLPHGQTTAAVLMAQPPPCLPYPQQSPGLISMPSTQQPMFHTYPPLYQYSLPARNSIISHEGSTTPGFPTYDNQSAVFANLAQQKFVKAYDDTQRIINNNSKSPKNVLSREHSHSGSSRATPLMNCQQLTIGSVPYEAYPQVEQTLINIPQYIPHPMNYGAQQYKYKQNEQTKSVSNYHSTKTTEGANYSAKSYNSNENKNTTGNDDKKNQTTPNQSINEVKSNLNQNEKGLDTSQNLPHAKSTQTTYSNDDGKINDRRKAYKNTSNVNLVIAIRQDSYEGKYKSVMDKAITPAVATPNILDTQYTNVNSRFNNAMKIAEPQNAKSDVHLLRDNRNYVTDAAPEIPVAREAKQSLQEQVKNICEMAKMKVALQEAHKVETSKQHIKDNTRSYVNFPKPRQGNMYKQNYYKSYEKDDNEPRKYIRDQIPHNAQSSTSAWVYRGTESPQCNKSSTGTPTYQAPTTKHQHPTTKSFGEKQTSSHQNSVPKYFKNYGKKDNSKESNSAPTNITSPTSQDIIHNVHQQQFSTTSTSNAFNKSIQRSNKTPPVVNNYNDGNVTQTPPVGVDPANVMRTQLIQTLGGVSLLQTPPQPGFYLRQIPGWLRRPPGPSLFGSPPPLAPHIRVPRPPRPFTHQAHYRQR